MNAIQKVINKIPVVNGLAMGYELKSGTTFEEWQAQGAMLFDMAHKCPFLIGDWVTVGEAQWGEKYAQALDSTKLRYETLRNYVWVCQQVELVRRQEKLTFSHHAAVASLPPEKQDEMLALAIAEGWSSKELRKAVRALGAFSGGGAEDLDGDGKSAEPDFDSKVKCPRCNGSGFVPNSEVVDVEDYNAKTEDPVDASTAQH